MRILFCMSKNKFPNNLIALAVRATNEIGSSHCAILDTRLGLVYDFSFRGSRVFVYQDFLERYEVKKEVELSNVLDQPFDLLNIIRAYHSFSYGKLQLVGNLLVELFKMKNPFSNGKAFLLCNEFILEVLRDMGYPIPSELDDWDLDRTYNYLTDLSKGSK